MMKFFSVSVLLSALLSVGVNADLPDPLPQCTDSITFPENSDLGQEGQCEPLVSQRKLQQGSPYPEPTDADVVVGSGSGLDQYTCQFSTITVSFAMPALPSSGTVEMVISAYDVDPTELDEVFVNGQSYGTLDQGGNGKYDNTSFQVNVADLNAMGTNTITIDVDLQNAGWCVRIDWIAFYIPPVSGGDPHFQRFGHEKRGTGEKVVAWSLSVSKEDSYSSVFFVCVCYFFFFVRLFPRRM
mmetsp:Transcript_4124/g.8324  ORF Transcript_4124/g.8324 Transcript_4124/m.8324 type:complete len:241 (-) Transcript_4124:641-1363(-)